MKKLIMLFLAIILNTFAQDFTVEKVQGKVKYLEGTSETWKPVLPGTKLNADDFLETDDNSFIQLTKNGKRFMLKSASALGLNYIKEVSLNDLLLALAMEEIRNVPQKKHDSKVGNTAVYGSKINSKEVSQSKDLSLGLKRINGAKQLTEFGYNESAIISVKETYRNYPSTKKLINERLYFVDVLLMLNLYEEALTELNDIKKHTSTEKDSAEVSERINKVKLELL